MTSTDTAGYRYDTFRLSHMLADMRFATDTPGPGDLLPQLDLQTLDGDRLTLETVDRPHLFVFGSNTCPMTASSPEVLNALHRDFGEQVRFVLVQVREAHPGEHIPQPATLEEKAQHAHCLRKALGVAFTVAVDDLEGSFHASLDPKPNAAYLVDRDGRIRYRSLWATDEDRLWAALTAVVEGREPAKQESTRMLGPAMGSLGHVDRVIRDAGPSAGRDLLRSAPPMLVGARLASLFRTLPPNRRGQALMATMGAGALIAMALVLLL